MAPLTAGSSIMAPMSPEKLDPDEIALAEIESAFQRYRLPVLDDQVDCWHDSIESLRASIDYAWPGAVPVRWSLSSRSEARQVLAIQLHEHARDRTHVWGLVVDQASRAQVRTLLSQRATEAWDLWSPVGELGDPHSAPEMLGWVNDLRGQVIEAVFQAHDPLQPGEDGWSERRDRQYKMLHLALQQFQHGLLELLEQHGWAAHQLGHAWTEAIADAEAERKFGDY